MNGDDIKMREEELDGGPLFHYYGDYVRRLFLIGTFVWVAILPFAHALFPQPLIFSVLGILILTITAGLTNPAQYFTVVINVVVSFAAVLVFEWHALHLYNTFSANNFFFWVYQFLTIDFLFALYFSVKTLRKKLPRE